MMQMADRRRSWVNPSQSSSASAPSWDSGPRSAAVLPPRDITCSSPDVRADKIEQVVRTIEQGRQRRAGRDGHDARRRCRPLFDRAMSPGAGLDPLDLVVYNAGNNRKLDFRELSAEMFEDFWRIGCFGGFLVGREAARRLVPLGRGTVLFTGASGSLRGKPGFAHFAAAKAGLRMIVTEHGARIRPAGHPRRARRHRWRHRRRPPAPRRPEIIKERGEDGLLGIDAIAETYWQIHRQPRSAWAQEIDLRPFKEAF